MPPCLPSAPRSSGHHPPLIPSHALPLTNSSIGLPDPAQASPRCHPKTAPTALSRNPAWRPPLNLHASLDLLSLNSRQHPPSPVSYRHIPTHRPCPLTVCVPSSASDPTAGQPCSSSSYKDIAPSSPPNRPRSLPIFLATATASPLNPPAVFPFDSSCALF